MRYVEEWLPNFYFWHIFLKCLEFERIVNIDNLAMRYAILAQTFSNWVISARIFRRFVSIVDARNDRLILALAILICLIHSVTFEDAYSAPQTR